MCCTATGSDRSRFRTGAVPGCRMRRTRGRSLSQQSLSRPCLPFETHPFPRITLHGICSGRSKPVCSLSLRQVIARSFLRQRTPEHRVRLPSLEHLRRSSTVLTLHGRDWSRSPLKFANGRGNPFPRPLHVVLHMVLHGVLHAGLHASNSAKCLIRMTCIHFFLTYFLTCLVINFIPVIEGDERIEHSLDRSL